MKRPTIVAALCLLAFTACLAQIKETQITDGSILARVSATENITGPWTFTARPSVLLSGSAGTPSIASQTGLVVQRNGTVNSIAYLSVISGSQQVAGINFGDESAETQGRLWYDNLTDSLAVGVAGAELARFSGGSLGIGTTTPSAKSILDLVSTTRGFLPPRMTTTQRDAITSPPTALTLYNTTTNALNVYNGSAWRENVSLDGSGRLVVNEASPSAQFEVESADAARTTAIFRAALNPTADQFVIEDNAGTNILTLDKDGRMVLGMASTDISGTSLVAKNSIALASGTSNASVGSFGVIPSNYFAIGSGSSGSGTVLPIAFFIGAVERFRMLADKPVIVFDEADGNPTTSDLDANDSVAIYTKADKLVFAFNNAGVMTYLTISLNGSASTWSQSTSAP